MFVVVVFFEPEPGRFDAFRDAIFENAALSREEPGCLQFDVCFSADRSRCFLYEVYGDRAAFDAHCRTPHFLAFDRDSKPLVRSKRVETYDLLSGGPPPKRG